MPNRYLVKSLSLLIGPPDALGAIPALQRCLQWADIWKQHEPDSLLADQLIQEINETLATLKNTDRLDLQYFPAPKKAGKNVFTGHSLSTSPLWSLTPIHINENEWSESFNTLAAAYFSWVIKSVNKYVDKESYESWIQHQDPDENPAKTVLSAVHEASLSIRRLVDNSSFNVIETLASTAWSTDRNAFGAILLALDPTKEEHKRVKRLRSLFHLAHGYRPLYRRRSGDIHREKVSNIKIYSGGISSTFHAVEIPGLGSAVIHTPIILSEDILGEDTDTVSLVSVDFKSLPSQAGLDTEYKTDLNIKKMHAIAASKAKYFARANHYDQLDSRRIHPEELRLIDNLLLSDKANINDRMTILITILSGRSIENIRKFPASIMCENSGAISLQLTINKPKIKEHPGCIQTDDTILSPIPGRWLPVIEQFHSNKMDIRTLAANRTTNGINRILKAHIKDHKISATKLHRVLSLALLDCTQDEGISSLFADHLTAISSTKNHYICIGKNAAASYLIEAWTKVISAIDDDKSIHIPCPQDGHIGSANVPNTDSLRKWINLRPAAVGTWEKEFFDYRKQLIREGLTLAHRGITDPNPIFVSDPNPDLKSGLAVINDKDRGGKGQMSRLAVMPSSVTQAMRRHDERTANYTQGSQSLLFSANARTPFLNHGTVIRPKELEETKPATPFPANGPRKLFRSHIIGKIPGELADAIMGWQTHGLVPYSEFSSLSPYMTQACSSRSITEFYESTISEEDSDENA